MVRRLLRASGCAVGLALAVLQQAAAAWGPLGHRAVGAVADALLTPGARAEVARLLADDRGRDGRPSGRTTLAEASLWPDEIRGTAADRPTWHYDNMPVCGAIPSDRAWCAEQQCASARLEALLAQLADRSRPPAERRDALKWIAHLVGDLHQPLHAADYAQGGNLIHVELAGRSSSTPWTLHAAWDVRLVAYALHAGTAQRPPESARRSLTARARKLSKDER
jgi:nuclease S1